MLCLCYFLDCIISYFVDFMTIEELPKHLKDELDRQANKEEAERRQREIDRNTCKVNVWSQVTVFYLK